MIRVRRLVFALLVASVWVAAATVLAPAQARASLADETKLADRYAPVVRLVKHTEECGPGEPYEPIDVDLLFGNPTVALRGPWNPTDLVKIGPSARDLSRDSTSITSTSRGTPSTQAVATNSGPAA